eukprot:CAMPEP_0181307398 /NCGR_PEP_ID=MMETSP1101-20121128/10856_1 /TAXON_ID=46948 /ORGANISM="Rhodomonas abbreviata, Strain Caron Lab Isolate" /LENGTH=1245 /DNA_ID=CAMNT_0023413607 /DNA_START=113 /DNA_END=3850 /DNA_ORIENTATION=+
MRNVAPVFVTILLFAFFSNAHAGACSESEALTCNALAYCDSTGGVVTCECPEGSYGNGIGAADLATDQGCSTRSWTVRFSIDLGVGGDSYIVPANPNALDPADWAAGKTALVALFNLGNAEPPGFETSMTHQVTQIGGVYQLSVNSLFNSETAADQAKANLNLDTQNIFGLVVDASAEPRERGALAHAPKVYTWVSKTSDAEYQVMPTGLTVERVYFDSAGCSAGCWKVDITYTAGTDNWNILYVPKAVGDDTLSVDFVYNQTVLDTWQPANFPCGTFGYDPAAQTTIPYKVTACCIPEFIRDYRPLVGYNDELQDLEDVLEGMCTGTDDIPIFVANEDQANATLLKYMMPPNIMTGYFDGMTVENQVITTDAVDPFLNIYQATVVLDETELRRKAGLLTGTVGVEYVVDTFVGIAEFKPTGSQFLDSFTKQTAIHLEKTNFFTVATHGTNDYTFLTYANLRLVEVLNEDLIFSDDDATQRFDRTSRFGAAHYVQVTFTLGDAYRPKNYSDVIPLDSVRAGFGDFMSNTQGKGSMYHSCLEYTQPDDDNTQFDAATAQAFNRMFPHWEDSNGDTVDPGTVGAVEVQTCAPVPFMCRNQEDIANNFVEFQIPLGMDYLPPPSGFMDVNVFVSMVIQVENIDPDRTTGEITKTTLNAAIPVVAGGENIFCDGVTAKADLQDLAKAIILVGTAGIESELARIQIIGEEEPIASSVLAPASPVQINSVSIESGLLTLVVLGNESFFDDPERRLSYTFGLELEDAITVHIMEQDESFGAGTRAKQVLDKMKEPGEELYDDDEKMRTEGRKLNGAFKLRVDREAGRASLEPTGGDDGLLSICGFSAVRASEDEPFPTACIIRRDWRNRQPYAETDGAQGEDTETATELPNLNMTGSQWSTKSDKMGLYMQSVLGGSGYAYELGVNYSAIVANRYMLDGRSRRAFFINPGYTWTVQQTGGQPVFTLTQKIMMFALFNLNEEWEVPTYDGFLRRQVVKRRFLLQGGEEGTGIGMTSTAISFQTSPAQMLADSFGVPRSQVATWEIMLQLTAAQACMDENELIDNARGILTGYFDKTATQILTLQITTAEIERGSVCCTDECTSAARREGGVDEITSAKARFRTVVVFAGAKPKVNFDALSKMPNVLQVLPMDDQSNINVDNNYVPAQELPPTKKSSSKGPLIGALCGVFAVLVLVAGGAFWYFKKHSQNEETMVATAAPADIENVKVELEADMFTNGTNGDRKEGEGEPVADF